MNKKACSWELTEIFIQWQFKLATECQLFMTKCCEWRGRLDVDSPSPGGTPFHCAGTKGEGAGKWRGGEA